jgi:hypothetical protein
MKAKLHVANIFSVLVILAMLIAPVSTVSFASPSSASSTAAQNIEITDDAGLQLADSTADAVSHRLIVQLESPSLSEYAAATEAAWASGGRINFQAPEALAYVAQLEAEQAAFVNEMKAAMPNASVSQYINEVGAYVDLAYQVTFNGVTVEPGTADLTQASKALLAVPGVKAVFQDYAHQPDLYASLPLINASAAWDNSAIGGMDNAGAGIKVASMDGGAHHEAPMFDGTGYSYPPGYPPTGWD